MPIINFKSGEYGFKIKLILNKKSALFIGIQRNDFFFENSAEFRLKKRLLKIWANNLSVGSLFVVNFMRNKFCSKIPRDQRWTFR